MSNAKEQHQGVTEKKKGKAGSTSTTRARSASTGGTTNQETTPISASSANPAQSKSLETTTVLPKTAAVAAAPSTEAGTSTAEAKKTEAIPSSAATTSNAATSEQQPGTSLSPTAATVTESSETTPMATTTPPADSPKPSTQKKPGQKPQPKPPQCDKLQKQRLSEKTKPPPVKRKRVLHPVETLLGETLVNAAGEKTSPSEFVQEDAVIGLYFAAKWCPPCRALFPELMLLYEEVRASGRCFEMVFVSFDKSQESFNDYLSKMPWWAVDYQEDEKRDELASTFKISGIPVFLLLDANTLEVINTEGRFFVSMDPKGEQFPWRDMPVPDLGIMLRKLIASSMENAASVLEAQRKKSGESSGSRASQGEDAVSPNLPPNGSISENQEQPNSGVADSSNEDGK